jgi:hypothetical protein
MGGKGRAVCCGNLHDIQVRTVVAKGSPLLMDEPLFNLYILKPCMNTDPKSSVHTS